MDFLDSTAGSDYFSVRPTGEQQKVSPSSSGRYGRDHILEESAACYLRRTAVFGLGSQTAVPGSHKATKHGGIDIGLHTELTAHTSSQVNR